MDEEKKNSPTLALPRRIRGSHANSFRTMRVKTNYYSVSVSNSIEQIFIYKVVFKPMIPHDNSSLRTNLLGKIFDDVKSMIPSPVISGSNIYSLRAPTCEEKEFSVDDYTILIKKVKDLSIKDNTKTMLHFLNNGLRNLFRKLDYAEIGRSGKFFQIRNSEQIDNDLRMFSGFKANFLLLEGGIFLRVDSAKKIVRNQSVLDYINEIYNLHKSKERDEKRAILKNQLIGQTIMTNYGKARYVRVSDIVFETVDERKLNDSDMTLREFYEQKYNKKVNFPKQPLLEVEEGRKGRNEEKNNKSIFIPEFCVMTGIPDSFDEYKRKKISEHTIKPAYQKKRQIEKFMDNVKKVNNFSSLKELGICLNNEMLEMDAKLVPVPKLELGSSRSVQRGKQSGFQLFRDPLHTTKYAINLGIFSCSGVDTKGMTGTFSSTVRNLGVSFRFNTYTVRENDRRRIVSEFCHMIKDAQRNDDINVCLIVIPNFLKTSYGQIKKECLASLGIVSQIVVEATLRKKGLQSIATKILLQIIAKAGNTLWVPRTNGSLSKTMIIAFDSGKSNNNNIISCVSTSNDTFSSFYAKYALYSDNNNKFNEMVKLSIEGYKNYCQKNSYPPQEIIVFHNSCTEDQATLFRNFYLNGLKEHLEKCSGQTPKVTLIMVNTKTCERFFASDSRGVANPQAGTLISESIVSENYDFYLVSQYSNRGCTVPNHYKVIFSDSEVQEGIIQQIIFSQCFNYVNWTGSIKIPGPLQYAKKLAKFAGEAMSGREVDQKMDSRLYFV